MCKDDNNTRYTLLARAVDLGDQEAWSALHEKYEDFIYYVLRELNVYSADIDDLAQEVLILLMKGLSSYDASKGKFRAWFRRLITNAAISHIRKVQTRGKYTNLQGEEMKNEVNPADIEILIEKEWNKYLTKLALDELKKSFKGKAMDVLEMDLQGASTEQIAQELELEVSSIYTLRKRVKKKLFETVSLLVKEIEPNS